MNKLSTIFVVILSVAVGGCDTENQVQTVETSVQAGQSHDALWGVWDWVAWWFGFDVAETEVEEEVEPDPRVEDRLSHVGEGVLERLRDLHASQETSLWALRGDAVWRDDSLIQTPNAWGLPASELPVPSLCTDEPGCDAELGLYRCDSQLDCLEVGGICSQLEASSRGELEKSGQFCTGHSDTFLDRLYTLIRDAKSQVDISSLTAPDGRFLVAIRNALTALDDSGRDVRVRLLVGDVPGMFFDADALMDDLTRDLRGDTNLTFTSVPIVWELTLGTTPRLYRLMVKRCLPVATTYGPVITSRKRPFTTSVWFSTALSQSMHIAISMFSGITPVKTTGVDPRPIGQCTPGGSRIVQMRMLLRLPTTIKVFQSSRLDALGVWEKTLRMTQSMRFSIARSLH